MDDKDSNNLGRIADALEKIAKQGEPVEEIIVMRPDPRFHMPGDGHPDASADYEHSHPPYPRTDHYEVRMSVVTEAPKDHEITVTVGQYANLVLRCSCDTHISFGTEPQTLNHLLQVVHEHIEGISR
jgi:hypothetical protein